MIKSRDKEWLKEEAFKLYPSHVEMYEFPDDLVVLKKEMADAFVSLVDQLEDKQITEEQAWDLIFNKYSSENLVKLHKKYLEREGYIVKKKEKLYTVCFEDKKNVYRTGIFLYKEDGYVRSGNAMDTYDKEDSESHLTEKEIKDYDKRFWQFAVPVEDTGDKYKIAELEIEQIYEFEEVTE